MPRGVRRFSLLSGVALCAILGGPIAVAQASDNTIKNTLNRFAPIICARETASGLCTKGEEAAVTSGLKGYPGSEKRLARALGREVATLQTLKRSHQRIGFLGCRLRGEEGHRQGAQPDRVRVQHAAQARARCARGPVPAAQVNAAVKTDKQGRKKFLAGLNLLKKT